MVYLINGRHTPMESVQQQEGPFIKCKSHYLFPGWNPLMDSYPNSNKIKALHDLDTVSLSNLIPDFPLTFSHTELVSIPQTQQACSSHRALAPDSSLAGMLCPRLSAWWSHHSALSLTSPFGERRSNPEEPPDRAQQQRPM